MKNQGKLIGSLLSLVLIGIAVPNALTAPAVTLTASVVDQQCQGGDNVNVTLTANLSRPAQGVTYTWDFNNDGIFDTAPSTNPTVTTTYPDEVTRTARVRATKGQRSAEDTVTFGTLRCVN